MIADLRSLGAAAPWFLGAVAMCVWPLYGQEANADPNSGCYACHAESEEVMEFADGVERSIAVDKRHFLESAHGKFACTACHVGLDPMEHAFEERGNYADYRRSLAERCATCHAGTAEGVDASMRPSQKIDGQLHSSAPEGSPLCTDCHASHAVPRGEEILVRASQSCADCHEDIYSTYAASVHGNAVHEPVNADLPACVDCHAGHEDSGRTLAMENVRLGRPCMGCHGDPDRMEPYGLSTNVVSTYLNDFHGVSVRFYGEQKQGAGMPTLVCSDCHGIHDVAAMTAGTEEQMRANLVQVCRSCHTDASEDFPAAWLSHYEPSLSKAPLVFLVRLAYWIFIPFVIIGLSLQIFAHLVLLPRRKKRDALAGTTTAATHVEPGDEQKLVKRFGVRHRIEHLLVMVTFILLLATGLPQKFWESDWAVMMTNLFGGIDMMRTIHRVTGIVFTVLCVAHVVSAVGAILAGRTGMSIVPTKKDFRDAVVSLKYYVGATDELPKYDRYDYRQKFEYWGMIVGSVVMILSGFILYFPMTFADYLPAEFIPAAKAAHTYEAMMALLTIVVWHLYGAHLNPDCFPLDRSIFTGKITVARMKHEHAIEWERREGLLESSGTGASVPLESSGKHGRGPGGPARPTRHPTRPRSNARE